ncbi:hypothetical protein F4802DRAFT_106594 [Xylaria palmicola]|nr:hypothetical protein F4802DRAFT_106594 [Xylaria palmicola]
MALVTQTRPVTKHRPGHGCANPKLARAVPASPSGDRCFAWICWTGRVAAWFNQKAAWPWTMKPPCVRRAAGLIPALGSVALCYCRSTVYLFNNLCSSKREPTGLSAVCREPCCAHRLVGATEKGTGRERQSVTPSVSPSRRQRQSQKKAREGERRREEE